MISMDIFVVIFGFELQLNCVCSVHKKMYIPAKTFVYNLLNVFIHFLFQYGMANIFAGITS